MSNFLRERVLEVRHWTEALFSFSTTRDPSFRFANGQFTMIGLEVEGRPLLRAYSMASANHEDRLEFFSIKVPDGPLTSRLQHLKAGDPIIVGRNREKLEALAKQHGLERLGTDLEAALAAPRDESLLRRRHDADAHFAPAQGHRGRKGRLLREADRR